MPPSLAPKTTLDKIITSLDKWIKVTWTVVSVLFSIWICYIFFTDYYPNIQKYIASKVQASPQKTETTEPTKTEDTTQKAEATPPQEDSWEKFKQNMEKAEKAGNTAEAIKWASEWIDAEPNTHFGYSRRAILKVELEDFSGALVDFKKQYQQTYDTKFVMAEIAGIGASIYQKADKYDEQGESGKACYYDAQALPYIQEAKTISAEIGEDIYSGLVKLEKEIETYRANHCL